MPSRACEHCKLLMKLINKNYKHRDLISEESEFRASETPRMCEANPRYLVLRVGRG